MKPFKLARFIALFSAPARLQFLEAAPIRNAARYPRASPPQNPPASMPFDGGARTADHTSHGPTSGAWLDGRTTHGDESQRVRSGRTEFTVAWSCEVPVYSVLGRHVFPAC